MKPGLGKDAAAASADMRMNEHTYSSYFTSYEDIEVHELMLKDRPRTEAYKKFIEENGHMFVNKVIMDVGAGTGILSLFAAKAGAKKVYAIEASKLSFLCEAIAAHNGHQETITVLHGPVEKAELPEGTKVDVIISEWMGFYLLHESMLNSIIFARDKWLKPDGIMLPTSASLYLCPVSMKEFYREHILYWTNVYGFDFFPMVETFKASLFSQPRIEVVEPSACLAEPELVSHIDMQYVAREDVLRIPGNFAFKMLKNGILHGFACWFEVNFEGEKSVILDTSPTSPITHWKQTVMFLPDPLLVNRQEEVVCSLEMIQNTENPRRYDISFQIRDDTEDSDDAECAAQNDPHVKDNCEAMEELLLEAMSKQ